MKLIPVETPQDFLVAQQFIEPHEKTCVSLASLIRRKSDKLIFLLDSAESVLGILNLDSTIYHCIPDISKININALKELGVTCSISTDDSLSRQEIIINGEKVNVFKIIGDPGI